MQFRYKEKAEKTWRDTKVDGKMFERYLRERQDKSIIFHSVKKRNPSIYLCNDSINAPGRLKETG